MTLSTVPSAARATARTWWLASLRPLVRMEPLAIQVWPVTSAESCPIAYQLPDCSVCTWTIARSDAALPEASTSSLEPAEPIDCAAPRVMVPLVCGAGVGPVAITNGDEVPALADGITVADTTSVGSEVLLPEIVRRR